MAGRSIHIGLNFVDPNAYGGWDGQLNGCINDANGMKAVADSLGYSSSILTDSAATSYAVLQALSSAAGQLANGDILWVSYSGHGGQVQDANSDESDAMDETWVLWDREVVDDELGAMWSQFASGVRILVTSDSCHSGTVARMMVAEEMQRSRVEARSRVRQGKGSRAGETVAEIPATMAPDTVQKPKAMPLDVQARVNARDRAMYDTVQYLAGPSARQVIQASVLLISGCQDNQLSYDGNFYGQFTGTLLSVWDNGTFQGNYADFHRAILDQMPPDQSPNYFTTGLQNQAFENQRPFTVQPPTSVVVPGGSGAGTGTGAGGTGGGTASATSRPTLRRGDRGGHVVYMQERLTAMGYSTVADGIFGSGTEQVVRRFQSDHGLTADGIVGASTWAVLEGSDASTGGGAGTDTAAGSGGTAGVGGSSGGDAAEGWGSGGTAGSGAETGTSTTTRPTIRQGDRGEHVMYLQQRLADNGYTITPDGIFGGHTTSIVRQFQRDNGLMADGVVGSSTWQALG